MNAPVKAHPFEIAGMAYGPYRFVGACAIPSPSLGEQNPNAYNAALAALPRDLRNGCGTCANCGRAIMNICIVVAGDGSRWGVGCDCIEKTGDASLATPAKVATARIERNKRRVAAECRREVSRLAWLAEVDPVTGETREAKHSRERAEQAAALAATAAAVVARFGFLLPALDDATGDFASSIAADIRSGSAPSGRALQICIEIYARQFGRRGSKAFEAAWAIADSKLETPTVTP